MLAYSQGHKFVTGATLLQLDIARAVMVYLTPVAAN